MHLIWFSRRAPYSRAGPCLWSPSGAYCRRRKIMQATDVEGFADHMSFAWRLWPPPHFRPRQLGVAAGTPEEVSACKASPTRIITRNRAE